MFGLLILATILSLIGIVYITQVLILRFLRSNSKSCKKRIVIVLENSQTDDLELELELALLQFRWMNLKSFTDMIVVDNGLHQKNSNISKKRWEQEGIPFVKMGDLDKYLKMDV